MLQKCSSEKSISLIKRHQIIQSQLRKFPSLQNLSKSHTNHSQIITKKYHKDCVESNHGNLSKTKPVLKRGRSLEIQSKKNLAKVSKNNGWKGEKNKIKTPVLKKVSSKKIKEQSISRVSHLTSQPTLSFPSSYQLGNPEIDFTRILSENKQLKERQQYFKQLIKKQKNHIKGLEQILEQWNQ